MVIELPWPPSVNHYWRRQGNRYFISQKGKEYKETVYYLCEKFRNHFNKEQKLSLFVDAFPPDNRHRDIDNILKVLLDSLQFAKVYPNDYQIDFLQVKRKPEHLNKVIVEILDL